ncbi:TPA: hypothetical protein ACKROA_002873 [Pseudomonas aeruginosa]
MNFKLRLNATNIAFVAELNHSGRIYCRSLQVQELLDPQSIGGVVNQLRQLRPEWPREAVSEVAVVTGEKTVVAVMRQESAGRWVKLPPSALYEESGVIDRIEYSPAQRPEFLWSRLKDPVQGDSVIVVMDLDRGGKPVGQALDDVVRHITAVERMPRASVRSAVMVLRDGGGRYEIPHWKREGGAVLEPVEYAGEYATSLKDVLVGMGRGELAAVVDEPLAELFGLPDASDDVSLDRGLDLQWSPV